MARAAAKSVPRDPYKNYRFRVKWDGKYVAGISRVSGLRRSTEVVEYREGNEPNSTHLLPGKTTYERITLERGVTHDVAFEDWAKQVLELGTGAPNSTFRKDIAIELYSPAGRVLLAYKVHRCWVCAYQALPDLDARSHAVLIEAITLQHEGWERDTSVP
jgi:phage tail-like protein